MCPSGALFEGAEASLSSEVARARTERPVLHLGYRFAALRPGHLACCLPRNDRRPACCRRTRRRVRSRYPLGRSSMLFFLNGHARARRETTTIFVADVNNCASPSDLAAASTSAPVDEERIWHGQRISFGPLFPPLSSSSPMMGEGDDEYGWDAGERSSLASDAIRRSIPRDPRDTGGGGGDGGRVQKEEAGLLGVYGIKRVSARELAHARGPL